MKRLLLGLLTATLAAGCAETEDEGSASGSGVTEVSARQLVIGETVEFYGHGFLAGQDGQTRLHFRGTFLKADGTRVPVDQYFSPVFAGTELDGDQRQILALPRFGPFANPFTGDASMGRFEGDIVAENTAADGIMTRSQALTTALDVGPSIIIEAFQPLDAKCDAPALRALAGVPYHLRVRTTGIKATRFVFQLNNINGADGVTTFEHNFGTGNPVAVDILGEDEAILFNPVGLDQQSYVTAIRVSAFDDAGDVVETVMPVGVHRPVEVIYDGSFEVAERYEPEPASGCIPGSLNSQVSYRESESETRQQAVSVTVSTSFMRSQGTSLSQETFEGISQGESRSRSLDQSEWEGETASEGYGVSYSRDEANRVGFSTSNGESWGWDMSEGQDNETYSSRMNEIFGEGSWSGTVGVKGEGSIPGFAKVSGSASTTVGVVGGVRTRGTNGSRQRNSVRRGYSAGGTHDETRSFGTTVAEGQSQSINGNYALSRSRESGMRSEESESTTRVWNVSEGVRADQTVSQGDREAVANTYINSETVTSTLDFQGFIPRGKVGIFYRQTTRFVRLAEVRTYDMCGLASHLGELQFNEWAWAPDLAIGDSCDVVPPAPNLPEARCLIPPCGG